MSQIKLFYHKHSRASRIRWAFEELGLQYDLIHVTPGMHESAAHLDAHPLGLIPAIADGNTTVFETGAICMYLADKVQLLAPLASDISARSTYYKWMFFAMTELDRLTDEISRQVKRYGPELRNAGVEAEARLAFSRRAKILSDHLSQREFMLDSGFSVVDILIASILGWAESLRLLEEFPLLTGYRKKMESRPAAVRSREARGQ